MISDDIDGDPRSSKPDVGADEFAGLCGLEISASVTQNMCSGQSTGAIGLTVTGGTPPYTFTWSNGATTQNITGLAAGTYGVTVTDQSACMTTGSWTVTVTSPVCQNITVSGTMDTTACFNATDTIRVAGNGETFSVSATGTATFMAGSAILLLPGATVLEGGYLSAVITSPTGPFCETMPLMATPVPTGQEEWNPVVSQKCFQIYPNPVQESFTLAQSGKRLFDKVWMEVYNLNGTRVLKGCIQGEISNEFNVAGMSAGLYFVKIVADDHVETMKLVKL